jgi:hypothetical protein
VTAQNRMPAANLVCTGGCLLILCRFVFACFRLQRVATTLIVLPECSLPIIFGLLYS